ncbi:hypothetical protein [Streptomyces sp. URMC 123]|uniref:hypothetical protein n=1 Tax=Streptomyces sp. URMC 123 TaxID=3423403 RepID=UPI003F1E0A67
MPLTTSTRTPTGPRRRSLLAGAVGATALLAGCSDAGGRRPAEESPAARRLRESAARGCADLLARYDATAAAHPALAERLTPLRDNVLRHAAAFGADRGPAGASPPPGSPASPASSDSASATASPGAGAGSAAPLAVPADERQALVALADAERRTADARTAALLQAPPELARLLASVAAAGACHVYLLTEGG